MHPLTSMRQNLNEVNNMEGSLIIRKVGDDFGVFKLPKIELVGTVPDEESLQELLQFTLHKPTDWPAVGRPYWFVNAPNPLEVSVNQGTITEDLMAEISEYDGNGYGNMFQTREQAEEMARKLAQLFE